MAHAPGGPDADRDGRRRLGPAMGWSDPGHPGRRYRVDPAGTETLAWSDADDPHDAYRRSGISRWEERRVDGEGQRRAIRAMKDSNAVPIRRLATALALALAESQVQHDFVR